MSFRIQDLPPSERPRERLLARGSSALSDRELLAIILRTGTGGASAIALAEELLNTFGGWHGLIQRSPTELMQVKGISEAKAIEIAATFEIHRRLQTTGDRRKQKIAGPEDIHRLYAPQFQGLRQEVLIAVYCTARHTIISDTQLFIGSLTQSIVHPREVFRIAINENAASVALLHNHPSGDPTPSTADLQTTQRFTSAGTLLGIPLLDHVIIAGTHWWSIKEARGGSS